jgi:hypothetical protein
MTGVKWLKIESGDTMHITPHKWLMTIILKIVKKVQNRICVFSLTRDR